jgi:hypothetical protein
MCHIESWMTNQVNVNSVITKTIKDFDFDAQELT